MSAVSGSNRAATSDFDYWEFVHCAICFLSYITDPVNAPTAPPSIPFWLTECGHTLCNNHLHADQSCAACGAAAIQLVPLQRDMMPPMCDWFRSIPHDLDALACTAKSQQETMASLIRFYKKKCSQQRVAMGKNRDVIAALRSEIEQLQRENAHLRGGTTSRAPADQRFEQRGPYTSNRNVAAYQGLSYEPSETRNANGKRPLVDPREHHRTSSPRNIVTPTAPPRLTLPPGQQQPVFPSGMDTGAHQTEDTGESGSNRFDQYSYQPPLTPFRAQPLRHQQQTHEHRRQHAEQIDRGQQQQFESQAHAQDHRHQQQQQRMPPPPTPSRAHGGTNASQHQTRSRAPFRPAGQAPPQSAGRIQMQPPPPPPSAVPRQSRPANGLQPQPFPMSVPTIPHASSRLLATSRGPSGAHARNDTMPSDRVFTVPPTPSNRFFPPRGTGSIVIGTPRAQGHSGAGGSTRAPFVPGLG